MKRPALLAAFAAVSLACFGCQSGSKKIPTVTDVENLPPAAQAATKANPPINIDDEPLKPLEMPSNLDARKVSLGKLLFHDTRLSKDDTLSCASCHGLDKGGTDLTPVSVGVGGVKGPINSPTVFNSGNSFVQFWDGRAATLEEQAAGPVHNPKEMASNWDQVLAKLNKDENYKKLCSEIYPDGMTGKNVANAIAEFERSLVTVNSRFDRYLKGDKTALSEIELQGYTRFKDFGCTTCHNGVNVGGASFQKFGLVNDYFSTKKKIEEADLGRFNVTKDPEDKYKFKVPSLRLAALTPPYFHDASVQTLEEAIRVMGWHQLGLKLTEDEVKAIAAFLRTLPGEYDGKPLSKG